MCILARARASGSAEGQVRLQKGIAGAGPSLCRDFGVPDDFRVSIELVREGGQRADVETRATGATGSDYLVEL